LIDSFVAWLQVMNPKTLEEFNFAMVHNPLVPLNAEPNSEWNMGRNDSRSIKTMLAFW